MYVPQPVVEQPSGRYKEYPSTLYRHHLPDEILAIVVQLETQGRTCTHMRCEISKPNPFLYRYCIYYQTDSSLNPWGVTFKYTKTRPFFY